MRCDDVRMLIEEVPLRRWTDDQRAEVSDHTSTCASCRELLGEQQTLFRAFDDMPEPVPSGEISLAAGQGVPPARPAPVRHAARAALGMLIIGGLYFLAMPDLFAWQGGLDVYWLMSDQRIESALEILTGSPSLAALMIVAALFYACSGEQPQPPPQLRLPQTGGERSDGNG